MNLFNDLCTLAGISKESIRTFLGIMMHQDDASSDVIIVTPTKADASQRLSELGKNYLSGKINVTQCYLEAPNGTVIRFIAIAELQNKLRGRTFKAIHFER